MTRRVLGRRVAVLLAVLLALVPVAAAPAGAVDAPRAAVTLVSQRAWTPLGGALALGLRLDGDTRGLGVRVTVHPAVSSRTRFERTVEGDDVGGTLSRVEVPAATLPVTAAGPALIVPLTSGRAPSLSVSRAGVYPLTVELVDGDGEALDGFVTHLVAVTPTAAGAPAIGEPLAVAWVWPLVARPAHRPGGLPDRGVVEQLGPVGRLGAIAGALQGAGVPLTLAPGPETVQSWAALARRRPEIAAGVAALRAGAQSHQLLRAPYVPIDVPGLQRAGLGGQVAEQFAAGTDALNDTLGTRVDPRTAVADPVDGSTLGLLRGVGTDRVIVEPASLVAEAAKFTPAAPVVLESDGTQLTAAVADAPLAGLLTGDAPVALRAQRFLSALAVIAHEQPNVARGVVVLPAAEWAPPADLLTTVLNGLRDHPLLRPVTVDGFFDAVPAGGDGDASVREVAAAAPSSVPAVTEEEFGTAQDQLAALRNLVGRADLRVAAGERSLLVSLSSLWTGVGGARRARAELASIGDALASIVSGVAVPERRSLTLTAREAEIPVSFQNDTGQPIRVKVTLASDKLFFPDGSVRILTLPPRNTTARFTVEARASGTFPMSLEVASADGRVVFSQSRITVRSTVVSNVGIFLTVGAVLFLAIWWLNHARRRRRGGGSGVPAPVPSPA